MSKPKRVLIITYYWPPAGGSGVQRWLKFVKYLVHENIEPIVYTAVEESYATLDSSLNSDLPDGLEVIRTKVFEPNKFFRASKKRNAKSEGFLNPNPSRLERLVLYVRANYFIPDARKYWIKPSIKHLTKYLKENPVDLIITTGPPHSLHLVGLALKKKFGTKWISDFRDPWSKIDYFHKLPMTEKSFKKHEKLEEEVVKESDAVIVIGKSMQQDFLKFNSNTHVITNGFDVSYEAESNTRLDEKFSIVHIGMLNSDRNQRMLWEILSELKKERSDFAKDLEIKFIGKACQEAKDQIKEFQLEEDLNDVGYIEHQYIHAHQQSAQVLLLLVNRVPTAKGVITGKIFEYLIARRPILAIGPEDGDLAEILVKTKAGSIVEYDDKGVLKEQILKYYEAYKSKNLRVDSINIEQYHRKELTKQLKSLIDTL